MDKIKGIMLIENTNLIVLYTLAIGLTLASIFCFISHRLKISPIVGYLLAGYIIGPYSPGFVADIKISEQLAEIGVVLMMFGVGLKFAWQDLFQVKRIAVPSAIGLSLITVLLGVLLIHTAGWSIPVGILFGLALAVSSTVVLARVLSDIHLLHTPEGHVALGWTVVEDLITVLTLLLVPPIADSYHNGSFAIWNLFQSFGIAIFRAALLFITMFTIGRWLVHYVFNKVLGTHSLELFTLAVLALTFVLAAGSSIVFGTSIALGAFLAGMILGKTKARKRIAFNATPIRDAFVVIFFISIGMLFDPKIIIDYPLLVLGAVFLVVLIKPLAALLMCWICRYPLKSALIVALSLAQIGEFSFILAEEALRYNVFPDEVYDLIVAASLLSITINPFLFRIFPSIREKIKAHKL